MANHRSRNKPPNDTSPEITTTSTSLGRETLVAIAEDEADQARALLERKRRSSPPPRSTPASAPRSAPTPPTSAPRVSPRTIPAPVAPQATIPAIAPARVPVNALAPPTSVTFDPNGRSQMVTMDYQDPPPNRGRRESSEPTIETGLQPMGRETLAAITTDLAQELLKALSSEERANWLLQLDDAMVLEPFRFEVRGAPMLARPNDTLRREFVAVKLLHRLPVRTIDQVERIDVAPTADDGLTLTIWVKIPELGGLPPLPTGPGERALPIVWPPRGGEVWVDLAQSSVNRPRDLNARPGGRPRVDPTMGKAQWKARSDHSSENHSLLSILQAEIRAGLSIVRSMKVPSPN